MDSNRPSGRRWRAGLLLGALLVVGSGCHHLETTNSGSKLIDGQSDGIVLPTFRAVFPSVNKQPPPPPSDPTARGGPQPQPQRVSHGLGFEISGTYATDDFDQDVAAGEVVRFDGIAFPGPTTVPFHYDMVEVSAAIRGGLEFSRAQLDFLGGVGFNYFEAEVRDASPRIRDREGRFGPLIGANLRIELLDWLALYGRATYLWSVTAASGQAEGGVDLEPIEGIGLLAGYRYWRYRNTEFGGDTDSDINVVATGLVLGVEARF